MKKIILAVSFVLMLSLAFAFTAFADEVSVHNGRVDLSATVTLNNGETVNLFDSEGNALIWYLNSANELNSIRADDERVRYYGTYAFTVGDSVVGKADATEVSKLEIVLENETVSSKRIVVFNIMDDDVKTNEGSKKDKVVNCLKDIMWSNTSLEYVYLRLDTIAIQANAFNACTNLKYVNLAELTELRQIGGSQSFSGCTSLFKGQELDLTGTKLVAFSGSGAFNRIPATAIKLPETVTSMGEWNMQGTAITSFVLPSKITNIAGSQFNDCKSLTSIYISSTTVSIADRAFNNTALEKIFFVGTLEQLGALLDKTGANNNNPFWNVVGSNRENLISYADYLELENKSGKYVVYDYSWCEAYNSGVHEVSGSYELVPDVDYFVGAFFAVSCQNCICSVVDGSMTIGPMFIDYGYSVTEFAINGVYSMSQLYSIDQDNIKAFEASTGETLEYGVVASISADPFGEEGALENSYVLEQKYLPFNHTLVITSGFTSENANKLLTSCVFVKLGDKVSYLDGGKTFNKVEQKTYNEIREMLYCDKI